MPVNSERRRKIAALVPHGTLATKQWLVDRGVPRHGIDNLVKSGQLVVLVPGVYRRPETVLSWQGVVSSLQWMGWDAVPGGLTALEALGFGHYLMLSRRRTIHLFGRYPLPGWVNKLGLEETFRWHGNARFWGSACLEDGVAAYAADLPREGHPVALRVSTPERAILEVLAEVPGRFSFEHADQLMQGLATLSPRRLEKMLPQVRHVKAKRLFFWLAERQGHAWFRKMDPEHFDLGRGKRLIARGGMLDRKYLITVPGEMQE